MKVYTAAVVAVAAAAVLSLAARSTQPEAPSRDALLAEMEKSSSPAAEHKALEVLAGEFLTTGRALIGPETSLDWKGVERARMILGGRFLEIDFDADPGQKPDVHSKTVLGFDTRVKKYTLWSIDTLGTYSVDASGDLDQSKKELTLHGTVQESGQAVKFKFVFHLTSPKEHAHEMWMDIPGQGWTRMVESRSTAK